MVNFIDTFAKKHKLNPVGLDVVISLIPGVIFAFLAYGISPVLVIITSVASAILTEYLFSLIFLNKKGTVKDMTCVISSMLLAFLLPPFTPLYTVAFGASMAMIFGKLAFGGIGRNKFNPAVMGREFITVFLFSTLAGSLIKDHSPRYLHIFDKMNLPFIDRILWDPVGNIGNYSPLFLILGGLYLLYKKRITFHTPLCLFLVLLLGINILKMFGIYLPYSFGGPTLIAAFYIATDPVTTSNNKNGKIFQGILLGIFILIFLFFGLNFGIFKYKYFTLSILSLNLFVPTINKITKTKENESLNILKTLGLAAVMIIFVILLSHVIILGYLNYILYFYILYAVYKFFQIKTPNNKKLAAV